MTGRIPALVMLIALAFSFAVPTPAYAFLDTGNAPADIAEAIARNRGLALTTSKEIAKELGTEAVGGSVLGRVFRRLPIGKAIAVAGIGAVLYSLYRAATAPSAPQGFTFGSVGVFPGVYTDPDVPNFYLNLYQTFETAPVGSSIRIRTYDGSRFVDVVYVKLNIKMTGGPYTNTTIHYGDSYSSSTQYTGISRYYGDEFIEGGETYRTALVPLQFPDGASANVRWKYINEWSVPTDTPETDDKIKEDPKLIPADADVIPKHIAEDLNDLLKKAREKKPDSQTLRDFAEITENEVKAAVPAGSPLRKAGRLAQADPEPKFSPDSPDPGTNPGTGGGGNDDDDDDDDSSDHPTGDIFQPWRQWMVGPFRKYLHPNITIRQGQCPTQPIDMGGMFTRIAGTRSEVVNHSEFCDYVESKRNLIVPIIYLFALMGSFIIVMKYS